MELQEEVKSLKALGDHFERQLKLLGIQLSDLPDEAPLLDKCVELQEHTHIHDLNLNNLQDYYYGKKRESIENNLIKMQQLECLRQPQMQIEQTIKDVAELDRFINTAHNSILPDAVLQERQKHQQANKEVLLNKQKTFKTPPDFNIDSILDKINLLQSRPRK